MNCAALSRVVPQIRTVGLCHSVQGTAKELAADIGIDPQEIRFLCAGINHMAFYLKFERRLPDGSKEDLYPRIRKVIDEGRVPDWNRVRYEVFKHFGYFVTESSEHFSEYVPWFIKRDRPDLIEKFNIPLDEYIRRCEVQIARWENDEKELTSNTRMQVNRSKEYAAGIILAEMTGQPIVINGNVENRGYIDNLPNGVCVEVPCLIDHNGVQPISVGKLPPQLAAMMRTNINVQELTVEAIVTGNLEYAKHAAMLDPHTAAELDPEQICAMVDELLAAHGAWVPGLEG
jgi:alpha-galactosidase